MLKHLPKLLVAIAILSITACASKKYAKQAQKYAEAGLFRDAAQMYYQSVAANPKNIDAKMGLQRTGQLLLQEKLDAFKTHYDNNATKEAVYAFIDAQNYFNQIKNVGVMLLFPSEQNVYFNDVKDKYLQSIYSQGLQTLDAEDFASSEKTFSEILSIDPAYKDSKTHFTTAKYEPLYRKAVEEFETGLYRTAYWGFHHIIGGTGNYKDAIARRAEALDNAIITVAVVPFYQSGYSASGYAQILRTKTINELNQLKSPFYKVVTDEALNSLPADGRKSLPKELLPFLSTYSQSISAHAVLTGRILGINERNEPTKTTEKRGYLKRVEEITDKTTGEKKKVTYYDKVLYHEYYQRNQSSVSFEYTLLDVKTGGILVTDVVTLSNESTVNYASYKGDTKRLIPGYWKQSDKDSPEDVVNDNNDKISALQSLLNATREIKTAQTLTSELFTETSRRVASSIENYNPEK
ncbi:MAG: hypothetical protein QM786_05165 [Breznakibacter sp.]